MKIHNKTQKEKLCHELIINLRKFRQQRKFNAKEYLRLKIKLINNYLLKSKINTVVVAVSGGIDSAVVLGIINNAKKQKNSPIKKIVAVTLPVTNNAGAVGQIQSKNRAENLCKKWNIPIFSINLESSHRELSTQIESKLGIEGHPWAKGQLVSYIRTPTLYYINSLMAERGFPSVIAGTTNKSEGSYLGYVGKASDGMVDIQVISDLYKSEVYKVGELLKVSQEILKVAPTGDMFDGRNDEEIFGASYDFVELYLEILSGKKLELKTLMAQKQFEKFKKSLDDMHAYNSHKYLVGSPAVHLDLIENKIYPYWGQRKFQNNLDITKIVNIQNINIPLELKNKVKKVQKKDVSIIKKILSKKEQKEIIKSLKTKEWVRAGETGYVSDISKGSERLSIINNQWQKELTKRISKQVPQYLEEDGKIFRFVEVANLFRFIKYDIDGKLLPHRDLSFKVNEKQKTLKSFVIYLTEGSTTFLKNKKGGDWHRPSKQSEIDFEVTLNAGDAIVFCHDKLHESKEQGKEKIIIRTDLIYEEC